MGFVGDIGSKVGGMFGFGGGMNQFQATAPVNAYQTPGMQDFSGAMGQGLANSNQARGNQDQLIAALQQQAAGTGGPSPAQQMLSQALSQNQAQAAGTIGSQRGINPGLAARMAVNQQANMGQQAAGQGALMRSQEQLNAQGMLGQALQGQRQQDLGQYGQAGQMYMQGNQLNQLTGAQNAGFNLGAQQINAGVAQQNAGIAAKSWGGLLGGIGGGLSNMSMPGGAGASGAAAVPPEAAMALSSGGRVPVDSPQRDTVPAMLSPGEVVLPRSVMQAADAPDRAAEFVRALHRSSGGPVPDQGYGRVLAKTRELEKRLKLVESGLMSKKEAKKVGKAVGT